VRLLKTWLLAALTLFWADAAAQGTWVVLDFPGAESTSAFGIDGHTIVGRYGDSSGRTHGFIYDGLGWITLDFPGATDTRLYAIEGSRIGGRFTDASGTHGFLYDGTDWTTLDGPGAFRTAVLGIEGQTAVGTYIISAPEGPGAQAYGFSFDGGDLRTIAKPGATFTVIAGIDGGKMVGHADYHGFLYDGATWTDIEHPYARGPWFSFPHGIDGDNIVGTYWGYRDALDGRPGEQPTYHGYFFDGEAFRPLDFPGSLGTYPSGIDGVTIVGSYSDGSGRHGFIYTIPEPATILLLGLGGMVLLGRHRLG